MRHYRFDIGETVLFTERRAEVSWKAEYIVVAHVPADELELRYYIRSTNRHYDRVAHDHELTSSS
jgi:hypothetical protein